MTTSSPDSARAGGDFALIILLAAVTAIGPFSMHVLSPALPEIARDFQVPAAAAQLMLSLSLLAMAVATLIWGPISDALGRRPVLIAGLVLGALGSALAALAPELWLAILGRLLQAGGGAAGMVLARAVAQDVFGSERSAGVIGQITAVMVAAPMIAPAVSGLIVEVSGWRGVFWMVALVTGALVVWSRLAMPETAPKGGRATGLADLVRGFGEIGRIRAFWRYAAYASFGLSSFYYFVAIAPYIMREAFQQGAAAYGFYFMILSATFMATNFIAGPVSQRFGAEQTLMFGAWLALVGPVLTAALLLSGIHQPWVLFVPGMLGSLGAGLAMPNAMAGAVSAASSRAGAASGLLGFSQFIVAAVVTQVAGFLPHDVALTAPLGMIAIVFPGIMALVWLKARPV